MNLRPLLVLASAVVALPLLVPHAVYAQVVLTGSYNNQPYGAFPNAGFVAAPGQSYVLAATATFDNNLYGSGFLGADGDITVDGADISGNFNHGLFSVGNVTINSGTFDNNREGLFSDGNFAVINGGVFSGDNAGIYAIGSTRGSVSRTAQVTVNGGTFTSPAGTPGHMGIYGNDGTRLTVTGGDFIGNSVGIRIDDNTENFGPVLGSFATIMGGTFSGGKADDLYTEGGVITVYGTFVGGPRTLTGSGTFTGVLENGGGTQTLRYYTGPDDNYQVGKIVLAAAPTVPEISSGALFALGLLPIGLLAVRRKN